MYEAGLVELRLPEPFCRLGELLKDTGQHYKQRDRLHIWCHTQGLTGGTVPDSSPVPTFPLCSMKGARGDCIVQDVREGVLEVDAEVLQEVNSN